MQMLLITMSKDIPQVVNIKDIIEEAWMIGPTTEEWVLMSDIVFHVIETYMELFENHIDTASLHRMQVPSYPGN